MRVLVVEDETLSALTLTTQLEEAGHPVIGPARSSGEAMVLARSRRPSVALVNINLESEGAGIRLAQQLCAELDLPVIFMTEHKAPARENADYAIGMIMKPFDAASLPDILRYAGECIRTGSLPASRSCSWAFELFDRRRAQPVKTEDPPGTAASLTQPGLSRAHPLLAGAAARSRPWK